MLASCGSTALHMFRTLKGDPTTLAEIVGFIEAAQNA
jgi:hypothetical protein